MFPKHTQKLLIYEGDVDISLFSEQMLITTYSFKIGKSESVGIFGKVQDI